MKRLVLRYASLIVTMMMLMPACAFGEDAMEAEAQLSEAEAFVEDAIMASEVDPEPGESEEVDFTWEDPDLPTDGIEPDDAGATLPEDAQTATVEPPDSIPSVEPDEGQVTLTTDESPDISTKDTAAKPEQAPEAQTAMSGAVPDDGAPTQDTSSDAALSSQAAPDAKPDTEPAGSAPVQSGGVISDAKVASRDYGVSDIVSIYFRATHRATVNIGTTYRVDLGSRVGRRFKSSKKRGATVNARGIITPRRPGKAKTTFKVGRRRRTLMLKVVDPTIPTSVALNMAGTVNWYKQDPLTLVASLPAGTHSAIRWKSGDRKIATVRGGAVTFKRTGRVTITATTVRGKRRAKVRFRVIDGRKATAIAIVPPASKTLQVGEVITLAANATIARPADPNNPTYDPSARWSSSDKRVCTVNRKTGVLTAKRVGTAVITVTAGSGRKSRIKIKVVAASANNWSAAYEKFVSDGQYQSINQYYGDAAAITFSLYDMDKNGTPELFVYNAGDMASGTNYVFTCNNGGVGYIGSAGFRTARLSYCSSAKYPGVFCTDGDNGFRNTDYYRINNGAIEDIGVLSEVNGAAEEKTGDKELVQLAQKGEKHSLPVFTHAQIQSMGWAAFVGKCPVK